MNFWKSIEGLEDGMLITADPAQALALINQQNIQLYNVELKDELTIQFSFLPRDYKKIVTICEKKGYDLKILNQKGLHFGFKKITERPILLAGILILLIMTLLLPTRVLFFQVEGNTLLPSKKILDAAEDCGIHFGVSRRTVRSEKMKNALLDTIPELKWAGINTSGCTATISVRERIETEENNTNTGVSSIVASRDGYITSCTVTQGNGICSVGQIVKEGQVLISGYTDCGIFIRAVDAKGEIFAQTRRSLETITPLHFQIRRYQQDTRRVYSLIIGKKRINLWKCSGISDATCGRMYEEYYITLPAGFQLPVCLAVETITCWNTEEQERSEDDVHSSISIFSRRYIQQQMKAGQILRAAEKVTQKQNLFYLCADYICTEMIGKPITEEIGDFDGKIS